MSQAAGGTTGPAEIPAPLYRFATPPTGTAHPPFQNGKFTLAERETLVFTGGTNWVKEAKSGALEAMLTQTYAAQKPVFRSMAVDADTVYEQARELNFGSWRQQLDAAGATVILAGFGQMESLDGRGRLPEFIAAYHRLLDEFTACTPRIVLLAPPPFETPPTALIPDLTHRNPDVAAYTAAIKKIAEQRGLLFVDPGAAVEGRPTFQPDRVTDNGVHLNAAGLDSSARAILQSLGLPVPSPASPALRDAIVSKNRTWSQCWRPANWAFAYGDRIEQPFGQAAGGQPDLKTAFALHRGLLEEADARIAVLAAGGTPAAPSPVPAGPEDLKTLSPEEELATFTVADGYEIQLVASERDGVVKPVQISWDERGRLLVSCSPGYPHLAVGAPPSDFLLMAELQDGKVRKAWKYAEGLTMTDGAEPGGGGIYVCDYDELVHYQDRDGDGHADTRKVIFSGFGIGDTHQLINSINHGDDGALWFSQGLHVLSHVETPWGIQRLDQAGIWRLRPRTLRLEAFFNRHTASANCWGVSTDDWGNIFHKAGDRPTGYYSQPGLVRAAPGFTMDDYDPVGALFQSGTKTVALDFVGSQALPPAIQGCAVIAGFMGSRVELHRLLDDGAGFRTEQLPPLLQSSSTAFRPVDISQGPDGAIYVCDFFNPVIGHYQASYRDPHRDKTHGRIWRISAKGSTPVRQPDFSKLDVPGLLDQLRSPERWTRYQAKRLLFDQPDALLLPALDAWTARITDESLLRQALGLYEAHETARPELLGRLLKSQDARVRSYATRIAGTWSDRLPDAMALLKKSAADLEARVRLEAIVAATYVARPDAVEITGVASSQPRDKFIDYALKQSINAMKPAWQPALAGLTFGGNTRERDFVVKTGGTPAPPPAPGKVIYDALCLNCHQSNAAGLPGIYPPLSGSEWVIGDASIPIKILLHGLAGSVTVKGEPYGTGNPIPMPPGGLTDQQTADVLTYVRRNFGNQAGPVTADEVARIRQQHHDRTTLWTVPELKAGQ